MECTRRKARWLSIQPIAHRGLYDSERPENSLAAIQEAVGRGYAVEFDVHLTNDRQFAVVHDADLRRVAGSESRVAELSSRAISKVGILGTGHQVALLHDVLAEVAGKGPLLISVKGWLNGAKISGNLLYELRGYPGQMAVSTMSPFIYWQFRRRKPAIPLGLVVSSMSNRGFAMQTLSLAYRHLLALPGLMKPDFVSADFRSASEQFITRMRQRGCQVVVWTIHNRLELFRARELGANVMFELGPDLTEHDLQSALR